MRYAIGSVFIVAGTAIGGGVLALPLASAGSGFLYSTGLLLFVWFALLLTALVLLEATLSFPEGTHYNCIAKATLGRPGQVLMWISFLLLLYALDAAYMTGGASLLSTMLSQTLHIKLPNSAAAVLFTLILGSVVTYGTAAVDYTNRFLFSVKMIAFIALLIILVPHVRIDHLFSGQGEARYLYYIAPIFLTSFGFHTVIPSIVSYNKANPKRCQWILIFGATLPLIIYLFWLFDTLSILPRNGPHSLHSLLHKQGSIGELVRLLNATIHGVWTHTLVNIFSDFAVTTSFLGVSLGLFDFLAEASHQSKTAKGRRKTALITFLPPLVFALYYPNGFILALSNAAIAFAVTLFIPVVAAWRLRNQGKTGTYRVWGGKALFSFILLFLIAIIGLQIANDFHDLPVFS